MSIKVAAQRNFVQRERRQRNRPQKCRFPHIQHRVIRVTRQYLTRTLPSPCATTLLIWSVDSRVAPFTTRSWAVDRRQSGMLLLYMRLPNRLATNRSRLLRLRVYKTNHQLQQTLRTGECNRQAVTGMGLLAVAYARHKETHLGQNLAYPEPKLPDTEAASDCTQEGARSTTCDNMLDRRLVTTPSSCLRASGKWRSPALRIPSMIPRCSSLVETEPVA